MSANNVRYAAIAALAIPAVAINAYLSISQLRRHPVASLALGMLMIGTVVLALPDIVETATASTMPPKGKEETLQPTLQ